MKLTKGTPIVVRLFSSLKKFTERPGTVVKVSGNGESLPQMVSCDVEGAGGRVLQLDVVEVHAAAQAPDANARHIVGWLANAPAAGKGAGKSAGKEAGKGAGKETGKAVGKASTDDAGKPAEPPTRDDLDAALADLPGEETDVDLVVAGLRERFGDLLTADDEANVRELVKAPAA